MAIRSNGRLKRTLFKCRDNAYFALCPSPRRVSVQPVQISVMLNEQIKSPDALGPQCTTRSISKYPGVVTSQLSVLMGIWLLSNLPGLVWAVQAFLVAVSLARQQAVHLPRTYLEQCLFHPQASAPVREDAPRESSAASWPSDEATTDIPHTPISSPTLGPLRDRSWYHDDDAGTGLLDSSTGLPKQCDRVLAVIARQGHKLIQQL